MAQWRDMTFEVSTNKVNAVEDLSFSYEQIADNNKDAEGTPKTNQRGTNLFPLSCSVTLHSAAGINVRAEISKWQKLVTKTGYFYLQGKKLGPVVQLRKVSVSGIMLDDLGRMRVAKLSLTFKEYDKKTTSVIDTSALKVGAKKSQKAEKKPSNKQAAKSKKQTIKVGSMVKLTGKKYATGQTIPDWVKKKSHKVSQIKGEKALLGSPNGICSWAYLNELTLV
ncbi:MAG: hypothetical protein IJ168_09690 [Eubacterium sp.]|nr:hypothetical protein [Eubacterium sp.]